MTFSLLLFLQQLRSIPVIRKSTNSNNIKRPKSAPPRRNNFAFDLNESKLTLEEKKVLTNDVLSEVHKVAPSYLLRYTYFLSFSPRAVSVPKPALKPQ